MQTKNIYCGDGWQFEITTDEDNISLNMPKHVDSVQRWEIEELVTFLKNYLEINSCEYKA